MKKVLLITGLHGSEQYTKIIIKRFQELFEEKKMFIDFTLLGLDISYFDRPTINNERTVNLNMNNIDDVNILFKEAKHMSNLLEAIEESDIVLDIHNSPNCIPMALISVENIDYKNKYNEYFSTGNFHSCSPIYWRYGKVTTISEHARRKGKLSFTMEFGGMFYDVFDAHKQNKLDKDVKFLYTFIADCDKFLKQRDLTLENPNSFMVKCNLPSKPKQDLLNEFNKLRSGYLPEEFLPITVSYYNNRSTNEENNNKIKYMIDSEIGEMGYGVDDNPGYEYGIKLIAFANNYNPEIEYAITKDEK